VSRRDKRREDDDFDEMFFFVLLLIAMAASFAGCATTRPTVRATGTTRPCATTLPTAVKLVPLTEPERIAYIDHEGGSAKVAMRLVIDEDVLAQFFGYVAALEGAAEHSLGCVAR
jgi:hypothetical protein